MTPRARRRGWLRRLWRLSTSRFGLIVVAVVLVTALVSLVWTPFDPQQVEISNRWATPSWPHVLGTDGTGRDITRGLSLLPPEQREVLLLVALEGMSYREAADVQGVPIGTVMSRLSRARTTLRTHVDGELPKLRSVP